MDRDEPAYLVDQAIHDIEGIGDKSDEGLNGMDKLFVADFQSMELPHFECQSICIFFMDRDV